MSRIPVRFSLLLGLVVALVALPGLVSTARAAPPSVLVTPPIAPMPTTPGATFFDQTFTVRYSGSGAVVLSANADGTGNILVDDAVDVIVTPPSGPAVTTTHDFSGGCGPLAATPPLPIGGFSAAGTYTVRVVLRDICGGAVSSTSLYLSGVAVSQGRVSFLNSAPYQFGAWNVGQCSGWNSINIRNEGPDPLTGVTATITTPGTDAADFQFMNGTQTQAIPTLGVQQTYAILIRFCPSRVGPENATLTLSGGNLQGGTQTYALTGSGKLK